MQSDCKKITGVLIELYSEFKRFDLAVVSKNPDEAVPVKAELANICLDAFNANKTIKYQLFRITARRAGLLDKLDKDGEGIIDPNSENIELRQENHSLKTAGETNGYFVLLKQSHYNEKFSIIETKYVSTILYILSKRTCKAIKIVSKTTYEELGVASLKDIIKIDHYVENEDGSITGDYTLNNGVAGNFFKYSEDFC